MVKVLVQEIDRYQSKKPVVKFVEFNTFNKEECLKHMASEEMIESESDYEPFECVKDQQQVVFWGEEIDVIFTQIG